MRKNSPSQRVLTAGAGVALLLAPFAQNAFAQNPRTSADARARAEAQTRDQWPGRVTSLPEGFFGLLNGTTNRAVIGVTTSSNGKDRSDTLGVLIESVTPESPADKAGLKAGARITAINGVNLKVASVDADDPELAGIGQRRLLRELGKSNPGDEVELRVTNGSSSQTYHLKTVRPADLDQRRTYSNLLGDNRPGAEKRASLGASLGSTGSVRDTLGIFITGVTTDGPAEKAGVVEGERIAAINGVDVRVPREDAEDSQASMARVNRLHRELAKVNPGDKVTLRVYGGGRYREVTVTTGSGDAFSRTFQFNSGDGIRTLTIPRMNRGGAEGLEGLELLERMSPLIRGRMNGDSSRVYFREEMPGSGGTIIRRGQPAVIRKSSR